MLHTTFKYELKDLFSFAQVMKLRLDGQNLENCWPAIIWRVSDSCSILLIDDDWTKIEQKSRSILFEWPTPEKSGISWNSEQKSLWLLSNSQSVQCQKYIFSNTSFKSDFKPQNSNDLAQSVLLESPLPILSTFVHNDLKDVLNM